MRWPSLAYSPPRRFDSWSSSSGEGLNPALLSCWANHLRKRLPRGSPSTPYPEFVVQDLRTILKKCLRELQYEVSDESLPDSIISSLELQNTFYNKSQGSGPSIPPADDDICIYLYSGPEEEIETPTTSSTDIDVQVVLPPTGVFPPLSKCYSPTCDESNPCYSPSCPHNTRSTMGQVNPPMGRRPSRCYSSNCEHGQGCYSPTCPNRYTNLLDDPKADSPPSPTSTCLTIPHSSSSSSTPSSPAPIYEPIIVISIIGPYITWIDQKCRPLGYRSRRPISSPSPRADVFDIRIGGSTEINVQ